jgi:hypothetical protein
MMLRLRPAHGDPPPTGPWRSSHSVTRTPLGEYRGRLSLAALNYRLERLSLAALPGSGRTTECSLVQLLPSQPAAGFSAVDFVSQPSRWQAAATHVSMAPMSHATA